MFDPSPTGPPGSLRASDAEREAIIDRLRVHAGDGRLTAEELEERIDEAYAARTQAQLTAVLRELPAGSRPNPQRTMARRRRSFPARRHVVVTAVLVTVLAAATGSSNRSGEDLPERLPTAVSEAATQAVGGGVATAAEREDDGGWEVEVDRSGDEFEVRLDRELDVVEVDD